MAVLRRRKLLLLATIASMLVTATIISTYYTTKEEVIIVSGDGPLLINKDDIGHHGDGKVKDRLNFTRNDDNEVEEEALMNVEDRMLLRKRRLKTACAKLKEDKISPPNRQVFQQEDLKHLIVNKEKHVLYCYLPKVANTNFRRVFLGLQGVVPKTEVSKITGYDVYFIHEKKFKYLNYFAPIQRSQMLHEYWKFLVVRDPLERLLSGFRNKFFHPHIRHREEYNNRVVEFYKRHPQQRKRANMRADFNTKEISFKEFLIYWNDVYEAKEFLNEHFVTSNQLCNPCEIPFDFIGKYETLDSDVKYMFDQMHIDVEFPGRNDNYSTVATNTLVQQFYEPIPNWLLKKTWTILKFDYLIFGYNLPKWFEEKIQDSSILN